MILKDPEHATTPLMSGTNAIHVIVVLCALIAIGYLPVGSGGRSR